MLCKFDNNYFYNITNRLRDIRVKLIFMTFDAECRIDGNFSHFIKMSIQRSVLIFSSVGILAMLNVYFDWTINVF